MFRKQLLIIILILYLPLVACTASAPKSNSLVADNKPTILSKLPVAKQKNEDSPAKRTTAGILPSVPQDLLIRTAEYELKLWRTDDTIETVAENIYYADVLPNGSDLLVAQFIGEPSSASQDNLFILSPTDGTVQPLLQNQRLGSFALSPNGELLAYSIRDSLNINETIFVKPVNSEEPPREITRCFAQLCSGIVWHPSGDFFTFSNEEAVWQVLATTGDMTPLLTNQFSSSEIVTLGYTIYSWEENGRYAQLRKRINKRWLEALYDQQTGEVRELPQSVMNTTWPTFNYHLVGDNQLLVFDRAVSEAPALRLATFDFESEAFITELKTFELSSGTNGGGSPLVRFSDTTFGFSLTPAFETNDASFYRFDLATEQIEKVAEIPSQPEWADWLQTVAWLPNESGLFFSRADASYFVSFADQQIYPLNKSYIGGNVRAAHWLAPNS